MRPDDRQLSMLPDAKRQRCPVCAQPGLTISDGMYGTRVLCARGCDRDVILEAIEWRGAPR
jgi:hypothetical protein